MQKIVPQRVSQRQEQLIRTLVRLRLIGYAQYASSYRGAYSVKDWLAYFCSDRPNLGKKFDIIL